MALASAAHEAPFAVAVVLGEIAERHARILVGAARSCPRRRLRARCAGIVRWNTQSSLNARHRGRPGVLEEREECRSWRAAQRCSGCAEGRMPTDPRRLGSRGRGGWPSSPLRVVSRIGS